MSSPRRADGQDDGLRTDNAETINDTLIRDFRYFGHPFGDYGVELGNKRMVRAIEVLLFTGIGFKVIKFRVRTAVGVRGVLVFLPQIIMAPRSDGHV